MPTQFVHGARPGGAFGVVTGKGLESRYWCLLMPRYRHPTHEDAGLGGRSVGVSRYGAEDYIGDDVGMGETDLAS